MQPEDVYELTGVGDARISPDGSRVAYVVSTTDRESSEYRSSIWVAPLDGSEEPRRFTTGEKRDGSPRWSPDGRWLAFVSNRGDEKAPGQIYVIPAAGGEARKLTDLKESAADVTWSPDSTRLAFTARVRDEAYEEEDDRKRKPRRFTRLFHKLDSVGLIGDRRTHVFVVDLDGGEARAGDGRRLRGRRADLVRRRRTTRLRRRARRALGCRADQAPVRRRRRRAASRRS